MAMFDHLFAHACDHVIGHQVRLEPQLGQAVMRRIVIMLLHLLARIVEVLDTDLKIERPADALYAFGEEIESNTIEVYVSRIRRKLGRDFIRTIRGLGYRLGD